MPYYSLLKHWNRRHLNQPFFSFHSVKCTWKCRLHIWWPFVSVSMCWLISPSAVYMRHWTGSALVQVMANRLFGAKPMTWTNADLLLIGLLGTNPIRIYCQLDSWQQILVKFESEFYPFYSRKCIWNCHLIYGGHFSRGRWVNVSDCLCNVTTQR